MIQNLGEIIAATAFIGFAGILGVLVVMWTDYELRKLGRR